MSIGTHVRRGDGRPWEYAYAEDYIPLVTYMGAVRELLDAQYGQHRHSHPHTLGHTHAHAHAQHDGDGLAVLQLAADPTQDLANDGNGLASRSAEAKAQAPGFMASVVFLASDDPDVYAAPEVVQAQRAQDRIVLASKAQLEAQLSSGGRPKGSRWVDQVHGWEGGFFASQFWGLGMPETNIINSQDDLREEESRRKAAEGEESMGVPSEAMQMRELVGRAYLLDLAVLSKADAVVCAVSSAACRVLAVMMGYDKAIQKGLWKNVDGGYPWQGLVVDEDG